MAALNTLYPLVMPWAPLAPAAAADLALRHAVRDFCRQTHALQVWLEDVTALAGEPAVALPPPTGYEVVAPIVVRAGGRVLVPVTADALDAVLRLDDWRTLQPGTVQAVVSDLARPAEVQLVPAPEGDITVRAKVALRPTGAFTTIDDALLRWDEAIAAGALARLCSMPDTAWFNQDRAALMQGRMAVGAARARDEVRRGGIYAPLTVTMRAWV